jgi:hypothetical protein
VAAANLTWPLPDALSNEAIEALLYPSIPSVVDIPSAGFFSPAS